MSLRTKITLTLALIVAGSVALDHLVQRLVFTNGLADVERDRAEQDLERVVVALETAGTELGVRVRDWSARDALQRAVQGDVALLDSDLAGGLAPHDLDLVYLCAPDGKVLWARVEDPESGEPMSLRELPQGALSKSHPLIVHARADGVAGLLMTRDHGGLLVGSHVLHSTKTGEHVATLILGRFLDEDLVASIERRTVGVEFELSSLSAPKLASEEHHLLDRVTTASEPIHWTASDGMLHVYTTLRDIDRAPTILLRTTSAPEITRGGERLVDYGLASALGTGLLILFLLTRMLSRIVIGPLTRLTALATRIGKTDDTSVRTDIRRDDEIGQLSSEFDSMLEKLEASRREVIRTARMAGMSEIATGVLHNVGNVLNSVNVSANLVTRKTEQLQIGDLVAVREVLRANESDLGRFVTEDPRGKHLLPFLSELAQSLDAQKQAILSELGGLNRSVEHIGELVRSQQSRAGRAGVLEPTSLAGELNAALAICRQAGRDTSCVEFVRDYADLPLLDVDRHKLMEIVVNLVKNALDALNSVDVPNKRLTLRLQRSDAGGVRIEVTDNGLGIAPSDLTRVFQHGFTTKKEGHGYGLHVSANAATEMKGSLRAESRGIGHGATFVLELPLKERALAQAA